MQLEFKYLAALTKVTLLGTITKANDASSLQDKKYWDAVDKVNQVLQNSLQPQWEGLPPLWVETSTGKYKGGEVSLGARGDSYYEYLLKQWLFTSKTETHFWDHYAFAMKGIKKNLVQRTAQTKGKSMMYLSEFTDNRQPKHKMDHLACFAAGALSTW